MDINNIDQFWNLTFLGGGLYDGYSYNIIAMIASSSVKGRLKTSFKLSTVSQLGKREKKQDVETNIWKTASLNYLETAQFWNFVMKLEKKNIPQEIILILSESGLSAAGTCRFSDFF